MTESENVAVRATNKRPTAARITRAIAAAGLALVLAVGGGTAAQAAAPKAAYVKTAEAAAKTYGVKIVWNKKPCGNGSAVGCYSAYDKRVELSTKYIPTYSAPRITFVVAHEASHQAIWKTCATTNPGLAGKRVEQVTSAYAAVVLKAPTKNARTENMWTKADETTAKKLAQGICAAGQKTITLTNSGVTFIARDGGAKTLTKAGDKLVYIEKYGKYSMTVRRNGVVGHIQNLATQKPSVTKTTKKAATNIRTLDGRRVTVKAGTKVGRIGTATETVDMVRLPDGYLAYLPVKFY